MELNCGLVRIVINLVKKLAASCCLSLGFAFLLEQFSQEFAADFKITLFSAVIYRFSSGE